MDRTPFRLVALLAAAFLVILCTDARADTTAAAQDSGTDQATQVPPAGGTADPAQPAATDDSTPAAADPSATQDPAADPATDPAATPTDPPADAPADPPASDATSQTAGATDPAAGTGTTPIDPVPGATDPQGQTSTALVVVSDDSASSQHSVAATSSGTTPPGGGHGSGTGGTGGGAGQLLPSVERRLQSVQGQIDDMQHQLDSGRHPSKGGLLRLRSSLAHITPVLIALERRLDAAGWLTPHLRRILQRVRAHLSHTRDSAAELIAALRDSGVRGIELRLLLDELARFEAFHGTLMPGPVLHAPAAPLRLGPSGAALQLSPSAWSPHAQPATPDLHAAQRRGTGSAGGTPSHHPSKHFTLPGAATVSSSGAGSAVAVALLATLLMGLAAPRLRSRLTPPPAGYRAVVFLSPLERPG